LPGGRGLFEKCVRSRQSRLVFVFVQISQENFGCAEKTAFVAQRWRSIALFAAVGLNLRVGDEYYLVMAVEYPPYELVSPELMRGLKILKAPADRK